MRTRVLGLGNDLIADDAVGILAARELAAELAERDDVDVAETSVHGLALLELFLDYDQAIIIDAIATGRAPAGSVVQIDPATLDALEAPSPHFAGLPEMIALAKRLALPFPGRFAIFAVEVADLSTIGGAVTPAVRRAIPDVCDRVRRQLSQWDEPGPASR